MAVCRIISHIDFGRREQSAWCLVLSWLVKMLNSWGFGWLRFTSRGRCNLRLACVRMACVRMACVLKEQFSERFLRFGSSPRSLRIFRNASHHEMGTIGSACQKANDTYNSTSLRSYKSMVLHHITSSNERLRVAYKEQELKLDVWLLVLNPEGVFASPEDCQPSQQGRAMVHSSSGRGDCSANDSTVRPLMLFLCLPKFDGWRTV